MEKTEESERSQWIQDFGPNDATEIRGSKIVIHNYKQNKIEKFVKSFHKKYIIIINIQGFILIIAKVKCSVKDEFKSGKD